MMTIQVKHNFKLLLDEMTSRGISINFVEKTDIVMAKFEDHTEFMWHGLTRLMSASDKLLLADKFYSKSVMRTLGYPVVEGEVFSRDEQSQARDYAEKLGYPVVIKPTDGTSGDCVFANLVNVEEFCQAFELISLRTPHRNILVEKHFDGDDYQFLMLKNKGFAVSKRTRPSVTGDGRSTIETLVEEENFRRMNPRNTCLCKIYIKDPDGSRALEQQGVTLDTILPEGKEVFLRNNHNVSWGGFAAEVTDYVHPSYVDLLRGLFGSFPGTQYFVVDVLAKDITEPLTKDNLVISEFNGRPAFSLYQQPGAGRPNYIVKDFVDLLFPETEHLKKRA